MNERFCICTYLKQLQSLITSIASYNKSSVRLNLLRSERDLLLERIIKERLC